MAENHQCEILDMYDNLGIDIYAPCSKSSSSNQYAAIDALIHNLELPLISNECFYGSTTPPNYCVIPNAALRLSILAIITMYIKAENIIFFVSIGDMMEEYIDMISRVKSKILPGVTLSIAIDRPNDIFHVKYHESNISYDMSEEQMISIISDITKTYKCITFYIDSESIMYAVYLNQGNNHMWVSYARCNVSGMNASTIMPELYNTPIEENALRLNIGAGQLRAGLSKSIQYQLNNINSSILSSRTKDKLCCCCAYMKISHDILCGQTHSSSTHFDAKLLTNFLND